MSENKKLEPYADPRDIHWHETDIPGYRVPVTNAVLRLVESSEQPKHDGNPDQLPLISPDMCLVLCFFFDGEQPYRIYSGITEGASYEEDQAFEAEVKKLRVYFEQRSRQSCQ